MLTVRITIIITNMTDISAQLTLQTWMSAAFPIGSFTCSHGMESAIADNRVYDAQSAHRWIANIIENGSSWNDSVLLTSAYRETVKAKQKNYITALQETNDLALALCSGAERLRETTQLGHAFTKAASASSVSIPAVTELVEKEIALPVAIGACGALSCIPLELLLPASMQASSSNLVWICTRLVPLGQNQALTVIHELQPVVTATAARAIVSSIDELGSCTVLSDLASIEHEELRSRICIT